MAWWSINQKSQEYLMIIPKAFLIFVFFFGAEMENDTLLSLYSGTYKGVNIGLIIGLLKESRKAK